ncbi:MAG: chorismate synthase [Flavobacteriales bacterium]
MTGNTFGKLFSLTTFGESHGPAIGGMIDGCLAGVTIDFEAIQYELDRRRPGQSELTTSRQESDQVEFLSGIFEGKTTGTPIGFIIRNKDHKSQDYEHLKNTFRPSHADLTYQKKYGIRDHRGGGRSSARETACRVVAGAIARQMMPNEIKVWAYVSSVGEVKLDKSYKDMDPLAVDYSSVRCPDADRAIDMIGLIEKVRSEGDSVGGVITCVVQGLPAGLGEPVFDKIHADLAKAMLSINAVKGFEIGSGFAASSMRGSEHNDAFNQDLSTKTNNSGGVQGGITNGEDIYFRVAFKPVATIMKDQTSYDLQGAEKQLEGKGRHDPCVVPRAVPIVEAMTLLVVADHFLRQRVQTSL